MNKQNFTREEVIEVIGQIFLAADAVLDIINNEDTDYTDEDFLIIAEKDLKFELTGIELVANERKRQIEELGYDYEQDSLYAEDQLARAGATYALMPIINEVMLKSDGVPYLWPWNGEYFKPTPSDRVRELTKAGALIAAQIDYELNKNK